MKSTLLIGRRAPALLLAALFFVGMSAGEAVARDASGKGDPEHGAGHSTPHGVQPGRGISGKPEGHGKGGTAHVPGPKGGHADEESHSPDEGGHEGGTAHVPGGKGRDATGGGHQDETGHEEGTEHEESHEPGPKMGEDGHEDGAAHDGSQ